MGIITVGGIVRKNNKYLLVQEAQEQCRGKWNIPAGSLDPNENIFDGAIREVLEECGYNVKLTGIAYIGNRVIKDDEWLSVIFSSEIIDGDIKLDPEEILDAKWFSFDEIIKMKDELRYYDWIVDEMTAVENNTISSIDIIRVIE